VTDSRLSFQNMVFVNEVSVMHVASSDFEKPADDKSNNNLPEAGGYIVPQNFAGNDSTAAKGLLPLGAEAQPGSYAATVQGVPTPLGASCAVGLRPPPPILVASHDTDDEPPTPPPPSIGVASKAPLPQMGAPPPRMGQAPAEMMGPPDAFADLAAIPVQGGKLDRLPQMGAPPPPMATSPMTPMATAPLAPSRPVASRDESDANCNADYSASGAVEPASFSLEETALIFDWDDTILPSTWVQCQGLRLDDGSQLNSWQRSQLAEVARSCAETLRIAKQFGTVVLVTNAERGWIELSCHKFMPTLLPSLEGVKVLSARTTYENQDCPSPLDWKVRAFESEISRIYGSESLNDIDMRKNVLSLGDSIHEREALLRCTAPLPNCRSKSLKFAERPDISQMLKQHSLVSSCFNRIVHHDGNLDLLIRCA
jgi:hypothetical protein